MTLAAGTRLGPYDIVARLGAGGMGEVYKATDTRLGRTVAVKVLPERAVLDPQSRERFEREAQTISQLNHPHICTLYDIGVQDDVDFLVMEYLEGETLAERLLRGALPLEQALKVGSEIAAALDAAHRQGIVHRDLKPGNVVLTNRGAKLLDFGLAKLRAESFSLSGLSKAATAGQALTAEGAILGTIQYMAPEQLEGREADARSDLFALGAVLYEMVTGRRPFEGKSQASLIAAIIERELRPVSELQPLSPPLLEHLIHDCLAKAPDDRWQTARDVTRQLQLIAGGRLEAASGAVPTQESARLARRARVAWTVAAAALILLAAGAAAVVGYRPEPEAAQPARFVVTTPETVPVSSLAVSPDGRQVAFVGGETNTLFVRAIDAVEPRPLPGTEGAVLPFWSPDSRHIGFSAQGRLKRVALAGGAPQTVVELAGAGGFSGGAWNEAGAIVFGDSVSTGLRTVSASGGEPVEATTIDTATGELAHSLPTFLPGGRRFLFSSAFGSAPGVHVGSLDAAERVRVLPFAARTAYLASGWLLFNRDDTLLAQRFDLDRLALVGEPTLVAESLVVTQPQNVGAFGVSQSGVLAYRARERRFVTGALPSRLTWYDRAGTALAAVGEPAGYRGLAISPDGRRIAVHRHRESGGGDLWVFEQERGNFTRLTFELPHNVAPIWSPDGAQIMFTGIDGSVFNFYRKRSNGVGDAELVFDVPSVKWPQDWSPDGRRVLFVQGTVTNADVWELPLDGGEPVRLIGTEFNERVPRYSPDGRWIAYVSNDTGREEVYVRSYSDPGGRWSISTDGGHYPRWTRSGRELVYLAGGGTLMAVDIDADGDRLSPGTPRALFTANVMLGDHDFPSTDTPYDVSADGERFLVNERVADGAPSAPLTVVLNWDVELPR